MLSYVVDQIKSGHICPRLKTYDDLKTFDIDRSQNKSYCLCITLAIVVKYINKKTVEQISMYYYGEGVNIMIYCYICKKKVNVVTCDYKSQCSHM